MLCLELNSIEGNKDLFWKHIFRKGLLNTNECNIFFLDSLNKHKNISHVFFFLMKYNLMIYIWKVWWQEQTPTHQTSSVEPIVPLSSPPHLAQVCQLTLVERGCGPPWCLRPPMSLSDTSHHSLAIVDTHGSPPFQQTIHQVDISFIRQDRGAGPSLSRFYSSNVWIFNRLRVIPWSSIKEHVLGVPFHIFRSSDSCEDASL